MPTSTFSSTLDLSECIKSRDFLSIKDIGILSGFGSNNSHRLNCYSILLGCGVTDIYENDTISNNYNDINSYENEYTKLIGRDIKRSGYGRWNKTLKYSEYQKKK
eukprot:313401_1